ESEDGVRRGMSETSEHAAKDEYIFVGGAATLLSDDDFRLIALFRREIHFAPVRAVDEHDDVGVLFDGTRFAQVGKLRAALFAFGRARQLAEHEDGNLQFFCEALQTARNAGHFFLAAVEAAAACN